MILFRYILLFFLFYLIIRFLRRLFAPSEPRQSYQGSNDQYHRSREKEGEVHINKKQEGKEKLIRKDDGEYINYEEVKED